MIFACADLHLGKSLCKGISSLAGDSFHALLSLRDAILDVKTDEEKHLLVAGDIYDLSRVDGATIKAVGDFCSDLTSNGVKIYFIEGNHDRQDPNNPQSIPLMLANASQEARLHMFHLNLQGTYIDGLSVKGQSYTPPEQLKAVIKNVQADILVLHQAFEEMLPFEGKFDLSFEDIPPTVKNVVCGDIHVATNKELVAGSNRWFVSPGSLHPCAIDQRKGHGFWTFNKPTNTWGFTELQDQRMIFDLEITETTERGSDELKKIIDHLLLIGTTANRKSVLALSYTRCKAELFRELCAILERWFIILDYPTASGKMMDMSAMSMNILQPDLLTLDKALPYACNAEKNPEAYKLLEDLLVPGSDVNSILEGFVNSRIT